MKRWLPYRDSKSAALVVVLAWIEVGSGAGRRGGSQEVKKETYLELVQLTDEFLLWPKLHVLKEMHLANSKMLHWFWICVYFVRGA